MAWWSLLVRLRCGAAAGSCRVLSDELARYDELLDLARAFEDAEQPSVTEQSLHRELLDVPVAAVNLQHLVGDAAERLSREILAARGLLRDPATVELLTGDRLDH